ncbi:MAG: type II toxin-antitoxin system VapC family toxin [Candidatus Rokubacteria bacterium]|nr:type II toxin-antitoxin system VapC family toxin [Candidatus Rokubacteria bacterium]
MPGAEPEPSTAVLDASVAVRWVIPERGSEQAALLLSRPVGWIAPRLMVTEVAAAMRRKVVAGELRAETALQALDIIVAAVDDGTIRLTEDEDVVGTALALALTLGHKVPDCLYLAVAEREGARLVTADRQLDQLARHRGISSELIPSA